MYVAIALDPRMKLTMNGICYRMLNASQTTIDHICYRVKKCLHELFNEYSKGSTSTTHATPNVIDEDVINAPIGSSALQAIMAELAKEKRVGQLLEISNEVDKYLHDPLDSISQGDYDILLWWKVNKSKYPTLALIARDVLVIPTSTVASENAFSLGGKVVDPFRASLTRKMVEALVCSSDWLNVEGFSFYKGPTEDELEMYKELKELEALGPSGCVSSPVDDDTINAPSVPS